MPFSMLRGRGCSGRGMWMILALHFLLSRSRPSTPTSTQSNHPSSSPSSWRRTACSPSWTLKSPTNPDGSLSTKVYRKPTHTDKYLDFQSHHPLAHKVSVVHLRAKCLCTFVNDRTEEELHVREALVNNGYPDTVLSLSPPPIQHQHDNTPPDATVVIPYMNRTSEAIRRVLTPLGIRTCFQSQTALKNILTHVKDPVPPEEKTGVVYRVPCSDCQATYVSDRENSIPQPQGVQEGPDHSQPHELCTRRTCHGHWA